MQTERQWYGALMLSGSDFKARSPLPASAVVPPRGCGGGGAMVRRDPERSHDVAKRNAQTSAKPRSETKIRSKVKRAKPIVHHQTRAKSKQAAWWRC